VAYASELEKLEQRFRENPRGRNFAPLADAYRKAGQIDSAIELCLSGLERHPDYVSAHIVYGRCLIDQKKDAGAEEVFKKVLALDPENIIALKVLAELAERGSRHDEAVDWLSRLLAADPMNGDAEEHLKQARSKAAAAKAAAAAAPAPAVEEPRAPEAPLASAKPVPELIDLDAVAATDAPTETMKPLVEHDEVILQAGTKSADIETFDGDLGFTTTSTGPDGLVVEESEPLKPDGLNVEGLARTQYEGSGMFRLDAPEGPPGADDAVDTAAPAESGPTFDLPLIMPDDITPSRRSSGAMRPPAPAEPQPPRRSIPAAVSLSDDDAAVDAAALSAAEPVVTETMGDLYLQQGHREDALRVYRALLAERPGDARLAAKLRELESPRVSRPLQPARPPLESATAFLRRVWRGGPQPAREPVPPLGSAHEVTGALEAAFALAPRQSASVSQAAEPGGGAPTQPAEDAISLDAVFGDQVSSGNSPELPPGPAPEAPPAAAGRGGFSFDDFFGAGPGAAGTPARSPTRSSRPNRPQPEDEDLDQFQAWLKGLKT
jgi:tetratricopeptide (TPR) repeat protein